jgi:hypothetical protein
VRGRVLAGKDMDLNYDHPILMLQLMLWHEGVATLPSPLRRRR